MGSRISTARQTEPIWKRSSAKVVNTPSAREVFALDLLLAGEPRGVMVVEGHALVSQDGGVLVLPMPAE